jgi:hypothetical protein
MVITVRVVHAGDDLLVVLFLLVMGATRPCLSSPASETFSHCGRNAIQDRAADHDKGRRDDSDPDRVHPSDATESSHQGSERPRHHKGDEANQPKGRPASTSNAASDCNRLSGSRVDSINLSPHRNEVSLDVIEARLGTGTPCLTLLPRSQDDLVAFDDCSEFGLGLVDSLRCLLDLVLSRLLLLERRRILGCGLDRLIGDLNGLGTDVGGLGTSFFLTCVPSYVISTL